MAHHKSAKKRIKTSAKKRERNQAVLSKLRTLIKKVFNEEDKSKAGDLLKEAVSFIDNAAGKGKIHKNTAARRKSSLTKYVNQLQAK